MFADPATQPALLRRIIQRHHVIHQASYLADEKMRKSWARCPLFVAAVVLPQKDLELLAIETPHLRHAESRVNPQAIQAATHDVNLDRQVWWRVAAQIDLQFSLDGSQVTNVEAAVRLQPAFQILAAERRGPGTFHPQLGGP